MSGFASVKTRFPPSPTGDLHIGGARVALFNYLFAKSLGGRCVLRMEDTDRKRSSDAAVSSILQGLDWLGLVFDEGPYYQTKRMARYSEVVSQLLESGHAYRCYCSKDRLDELRNLQQETKQKPRYDGCCRDLQLVDDSRDYVIRFKTPLEGSVLFDDLVLGQIEISNNELDDLIIARTDGTPTYHLTVVVDDWDMEISHVIRGVDHINNTPRQIHLFNALGATIPSYAHLPMVLGADGKRLSKRHGAVSVLQYRDDGYLVPAMLNQLVRLGWSCGDQEIFSLNEMVQLFSLESVNKSDAIFDLAKLNWLNQHYIKSLSAESIVPELQFQFDAMGVDCSGGPDLEELILVQADRCKTVREMACNSVYFYQPIVEYSDKAVKHLVVESVVLLRALGDDLAKLDSWHKDTIHDVIVSVVESHGVKFGKLAQPVRAAVTGGTSSPSIDATLYLLGRDNVVDRLGVAVSYIQGLDN